MAVDEKAQAIFDASLQVIAVGKRLRGLAAGVLQPVVGDIEPHADTIAAIKAEAVLVFDDWDIAKAAMDAAKTA